MSAVWSFLARTLVGGIGLWVASVLVPGVSFGNAGQWTQGLTTLLLVALVFGVVNALVKPVLRFFGAPLIWLTLGVFSLVINAWMLMLTSWAAERLGLAFRVDGFWWAGVLGALVVTVVTLVLSPLLPDSDGRR